MAYTKQTWDTTSYVNPTRMNHIEDGIYNAMTSETQGVLGAKNVLPMTVDNIKAYNGGASTWTDNSKTISGVTFTILTDDWGSVTGIKADGLASANSNLYVGRSMNSTGYPSSYTLNGCPSGGSGTKYYEAVQIQGDPYTYIRTDNGAGTSAFEFDSTTDYQIFVRIASGYNANNVIFKPMLRVASDGDTTFQPYAMTNRELTGKVKEPPLLLSQDNLSTTATSYDCDWSKYSMLNITLGNYNNVVNQILVPTSEFTNSSSSRRTILYFMPITSSTYSAYEIYRNGTTAVYIKGTNPDSTHRIKIYGIL